MNVRTFINLKKDVNRLASRLFQTVGSPLYPLTQTGQNPESEAQLLKYYTLMKLYEEHFPTREVRFYTDNLTSKESFRNKCKRVVGTLEGSKTAFREKPVYIEILRHTLTQEEVSEQLMLAGAEANQSLPENVMPVFEGNHFNIAYFMRDTPNCIIFVHARTEKEYLKAILNALDEALIYQLVITSENQSEEYIKELSEALENFKGLINDSLIIKAQEDLENKIMEISKDLYDKNLKQVLQNLQTTERDIENYNNAIREAIIQRKEQKRLLDDLIKQDGIDYSEALILLSRFEEFVSISTDGSNIIFDIVGDMVFDENLISQRFIKDSRILSFFKDAIKGDVVLKFAASIAVDPIEGFMHHQSNGVDKLRSNMGYQGVTSNPHHSGFKCFGSYRDSVKTAISASNWIAVGLLILESACSLNLVDGAVFPRFIDNLKGGDISFYYKNQLMWFSDYVNLKNKEQQGGS